MASSWPLSDVAPPSLLQLALALSIVKTKPPALDTREYLASIRDHVKDKKEIQLDADSDKRVDSITFWRQAYEKSEAEQATLLDKIYDLEQQISSLRIKGGHDLEQLNDVTPAWPNGKGKRKMTIAEGMSFAKNSSSAAKRTKTMASQSTLATFGFQVPHNVSLNAPSWNGCPHALPMLRHFCTLQQLLQKRKINVSDLVKTSIALSQAAAQAITSAVDVVKTTDKQASQLLDTLQAVANLYPFLVKSVTKVVSNEKEGLTAAGKITYHLVHLFQVTLDQMGQYVSISAGASVEKEKKSKPAKTRATKTRAFTATLPTKQVRTIMDYFAQSLRQMISSSAGLAPQLNPLEGFLFHLLHSAGQVLSHFAFNELETDPSLQLCSGKLPCPNLYPDLQNHGAQRERVAEWMSKYIIWLLNEALPLVKDSTLSSTEASSDLLNNGKLQLQKTLLQGVFGMKDDFEDGLTVPREPPLPNHVLDEQKDVSQWYTQQLWKVVGWDVLLKQLTM